MSDIPLTIKVDNESRLNITLSSEQLADLAIQVAAILKGEQK